MLLLLEGNYKSKIDQGVFSGKQKTSLNQFRNTSKLCRVFLIVINLQ